MGYEIKIYSGLRRPKMLETDPGDYFRVVAMIDICKPGYNTEIYGLTRQDTTGTPVFFYSDDGNTQISEDRYGGKLKSRPLEVVLEAIRRDAKGSSYRRWKPVLALLESLQDFGEDVECVLFGY